MTAAGFHRVSRLGGHTQQHLDCHDTQRCAYIFRGDPQKEHFASKEPKQIAESLAIQPGRLVTRGWRDGEIQDSDIGLFKNPQLVNLTSKSTVLCLFSFVLSRQKKRHFTCVFQCPKSDASTFK